MLGLNDSLHLDFLFYNARFVIPTINKNIHTYMFVLYMYLPFLFRGTYFTGVITRVLTLCLFEIQISRETALKYLRIIFC